MGVHNGALWFIWNTYSIKITKVSFIKSFLICKTFVEIIANSFNIGISGNLSCLSKSLPMV